MRRVISLYGAVVCAAALLCPALLPAAAHAAATQTFELRPGWNAIFLQVQPEDADPSVVFAGLPLESVWTFFPAASAVQFIQSPDEAAWDKTAWGAYFPPGDKAFLTNLYAVPGNRAYLVKLTGDQAVVWSVTGTPTSGRIAWVADSFNLVGFRVAPGADTTFAAWLAPSASHAGQAVYRLSETGQWEFVDDPATAQIRAGEAYWVYCEGASAYQGPLEVQLPSQAGLDFGAYANTLTIALHNTSGQNASVTIIPASSDIELAYRMFDTATGIFEWPPLENMPSLSVGPGAWSNVRVAVRRESLATERAESAIQISDNLGTRLLVPVRVEKEAIQ